MIKNFTLLILFVTLFLSLLVNKELKEENHKLFTEKENARYLFTQCKILLKGF